jgi:hypothetical protein
MDIFRVTSRERNSGRVVVEAIWAVDDQEARERTLQAGRDIHRVARGGGAWWRPFWRSRSFAEGLLRSVAQESYSVSPQQALGEIIEREKEPWRMAMLAPAKAALSSGASFVSALRALGLYDEATLMIVGAGERAQRLEQAVSQALEQVRAASRRRTATRGFVVGLAGEWFALFSGVGWVRENYLPGLVASGIRTDNIALRESFDFGLRTVRQILDMANLLMTSVMIVGLAAVIVRALFHRRKDHWSARMFTVLPGIREPREHDALSLSFSIIARLILSGEGFGQSLVFARDACSVGAVASYLGQVLKALDVVDPGRAFARAPLDAGERAQIGQAVDRANIADALDRLAEQRAAKAKSSRRRSLFIGLSLFLILTAAALGGIAWLLSLQLTAGEEVIRRWRRH